MVGSLRVSLTGDDEWKRTLARARPSMGKALEAAVLRGLITIEGGTKEKLDYEVLQRRTSTLFRSINHRMTRRGLDSYGEVGTPIVYAKTHELGLTVDFPSRGISIKYPKRPFLYPTFEDAREGILADLRRALQGGLDAA